MALHRLTHTRWRHILGHPLTVSGVLDVLIEVSILKLVRGLSHAPCVLSRRRRDKTSKEPA